MFEAMQLLNRRAEEQVDQLRIELSSPPLENNVRGFGNAAGSAVPARMSHSIERIGDRNHPCGDRNAPTFEMPRITGAIPSLVMREHAFGKIGIERAKRLEHIGPSARVRHHGAPLRRRETALFVKDVVDRLVNFSDVVKERDTLDAVPSSLVELSCVGEYQRVVRDSSNMRAGDGVIGVDSREQRLEDRGAESFGADPESPLPHHEAGGGDTDAECNTLWDGRFRLQRQRRDLWLAGYIGKCATPQR